MAEADGFDIRDIDPDLDEILGESPIDYPTIHHPQHIEGLTPTPDDGGIEDEEFDSILGEPEVLFRRIPTTEDADAGLEGQAD